MRLCKYRSQVFLQKIYNVVSLTFILYHFWLYLSPTNPQNSPSTHPKFPRNHPPFIPNFYIITPTYERWTQKPDLTRIAHSFFLSALVHNFKFNWIIVEDSKFTQPSKLLKNFKAEWDQFILKHSPNQLPLIKIELLTASTDDRIKLGKEDPNWLWPRGVNQRNKALNFIYNKIDLVETSLIYFADDDNTYDTNLFVNFWKFGQMNFEFPHDPKVAITPTGIVGGLKWEGPNCAENFQPFKKFHTAWKPYRPFPIDMASFILKTSQAVKTKPLFSSRTRRGYLESDFLIKYLNVSEYTLNYDQGKDTLNYMPNEEVNDKIYKNEVVGVNCDKILVWHTQTVKPKEKDELRLVEEGKGSREMQ